MAVSKQTKNPGKIKVSNKQTKFDAVSETLFALLASHGVTKVTHSLVAARSGVSRAWLYKYIGPSKEDLIAFAIEHLGKRVTERDAHDHIGSKEDFADNVIVGMSRMLKVTRDFPWFIPVYFKYRGGEAAPARSIREVEQAYIKRQAAHFETYYGYSKKRAALEAEVLTSFRMGLAFAWQQGEMKKKTDEEQLLQVLRTFSAKYLNP